MSGRDPDPCPFPREVRLVTEEGSASRLLSNVAEFRACLARNDVRGLELPTIAGAWAPCAEITAADQVWLALIADCLPPGVVVLESRLALRARGVDLHVIFCAPLAMPPQARAVKG